MHLNLLCAAPQLYEEKKIKVCISCVFFLFVSRTGCQFKSHVSCKWEDKCWETSSFGEDEALGLQARFLPIVGSYSLKLFLTIKNSYEFLFPLLSLKWVLLSLSQASLIKWCPSACCFHQTPRWLWPAGFWNPTGRVAVAQFKRGGWRKVLIIPASQEKAELLCHFVCGLGTSSSSLCYKPFQVCSVGYAEPPAVFWVKRSRDSVL